MYKCIYWYYLKAIEIELGHKTKEKGYIRYQIGKCYEGMKHYK